MAIPFYQAILGTTLQVPTLDGPMVEVKIPSGTQPNERRILPGRGIQKLRQPAGVKGHQVVVIQVTMPSLNELSSEQKRLMEEYKNVTEPPKRSYSTSAQDSPASDSDSKGEQQQQQGVEKGFLGKTIFGKWLKSDQQQEGEQPREEKKDQKKG